MSIDVLAFVAFALILLLTSGCYYYYKKAKWAVELKDAMREIESDSLRYQWRIEQSLKRIEKKLTVKKEKPIGYKP